MWRTSDVTLDASAAGSQLSATRSQPEQVQVTYFSLSQPPLDRSAEPCYCPTGCLKTHIWQAEASLECISRHYGGTVVSGVVSDSLSLSPAATSHPAVLKAQHCHCGHIARHPAITRKYKTVTWGALFQQEPLQSSPYCLWYHCCDIAAKLDGLACHCRISIFWGNEAGNTQ